jgi:lysophospholipase L1-like esterase
MFRSYLGTALAAALFSASAAAQEWRTSWYAAPQPAWDAGFALPTNVPAQVTGRTVREVLRLSVGGQRLRVVLSNRYGTAPLTVGAASIARPGDAGAIDSATSRQLTFAGHATVTIPPGREAVSDAAAFAVAPRERLAISAWYPREAPLTTFHWGAQQTGYIAAGNTTTATTLRASQKLSGRASVSAVHVQGRGPTIVAFGDSITDGNGSTPEHDRRWPDALAERLPGVAVANAGISGARLLASKMGVRAAERFRADVLDQPGVTAVVLLIGINDIGWPGTPFAPADAVPTAVQLIAGYRDLIALARSRGVRVIGGTLLPFRGALHGTPFEGYWTPAKEAVRQQVNAWIRDGGEFDAVADFDAALRDPADPERLLRVYDSGDHLHPGDAGYAAMAEAAAEKTPGTIPGRQGSSAHR